MSCIADDLEKSRQQVHMLSSYGLTGFNCYSDNPSLPNQQNPNIHPHFLQNYEPNPSEIYNLQNPGFDMNMLGFPWNNQTQMEDHDDQSNMRSSHVFSNQSPIQGQGLSLSLNPCLNNSFEQQQHEEDLQFGPSSSRSVNIHQQGQRLPIRNSKYLEPAQDLLNEFCNLVTNQNDKMKRVCNKKIGNQWVQDDISVKNRSLYSLDLLELQKRKTKLLLMLDEVDRRYKHYCDQMKAVVSSFEAVAGNGAATVYSASASREMSRHFRCLRDGIVNQINATKKTMGEKDSSGVVQGASKGETPRLRLLDQTLRQQKAFLQMGMIENPPWRPQRGLPERSVSVLRAWLFEHFLHPYPSDVDKHILARQTGLSRSQVSNWFINARVRLWKPMVEEMYMEELKEQEGDEAGALDLAAVNHESTQNPSRNEDQKPTHDQLTRIDSECLSSVINSTTGGTLSFADGGGGVSLTLGLNQHGGGSGVSLAYTPGSQSSSLFYQRGQMEDWQSVQYPLLDNESQTLPYRNLIGAQLLHDLAG